MDQGAKKGKTKHVQGDPVSRGETFCRGSLNQKDEQKPGYRGLWELDFPVCCWGFLNKQVG